MSKGILYLLFLTDTELSYDGYSEDFLIGVFETAREAEETAKYYLSSVKGFSEFPCNYRIKEAPLMGEPSKEVWFVQGWDINESFDEVNIVESGLFSSEKAAAAELEAMKKRCERAEWAVSAYRVGEKHWCDGFCRMEGGKPQN